MYSRSSWIILILAVAVITALGVRLFPTHAIEFFFSPEKGFGFAVDINKMARERRKAELAEVMKLDCLERCSKQGHLCSEEVGTDGARRTTTLNPWVEVKKDASNFTFGWAEEVAIDATGRRDQHGLALQYYSGTGQDTPIGKQSAAE